MSETFSSPLPKGVYKTDGFDGLGRGREHMGTDWAGPTAGKSTPVYAVADGVVEDTGGPGLGAVLPGHSGYVVLLDHGNMTDQYGTDRIRTNYGHLSRITVKVGQRVKAGQKIGDTGSSGNVTGVHLHFGVRQGALSYRNYFDGDAWLKRKGVTVGKTAPVKVDAPAKPKRNRYRNLSLRNRSTGADVNAVAVALRKQGYTRQGPTSRFTAQLDVNVRDFQRRTGLVQDGVAGEITQKRLGL